jgi:diguanylate cyclase (GGDEF)-like protein
VRAPGVLADVRRATSRGPLANQVLYRTTLLLRDLTLVCLCVVALLLPGLDAQRLGIVAGVVLLVLPYDAVLRRRLADTGRVPSWMAWGDQVLAAGFLVAWPEIVSVVLIVALLDIAMAAVMLDRRAALRGAAAGAAVHTLAVGVIALQAGLLQPSQVLALAAFTVCSVTTAYVVGTVAGRERAGQEQLSELLEALEVVVYEMDAETLEVRYLSPFLSHYTGRPVEDYLGDPTPFMSMIHRRDSEQLLALVGAAAEGRRSYDFEYRIYDAYGEQHWVRNISSVQAGPDGRPLIRGSIADITRQKDAEVALARQARSDSLTGLANRAQLLEVLATSAPDARLLVFLDLDDFKRINDSLGHAAGDALLVQVASRLQSAVRPGDVVARLGGDEFVVLLGLPDRQDAEPVVNRVQRVFDAPFALEPRYVRVTASAGALIVEAGTALTGESLLERADAAMYSAKHSGPGRSAFFTTSMREAALRRLDLESELRTALAEQQFHLVYQPVVQARDRSLVGHEALVRWDHPVRGLVSPADFVPVAEQTGQIVDLGRWVLREACLQARQWRDSAPGYTMSVNLSARQLSDPHLVDDVAEALAAAGLDPSVLCLEITETALIAHPDQALTALRELRATGVTVALDDFGTGYSSLSHLHQYPVDTVKIDRSFVAQLGGTGATDGIVTAILHLARHMDLRVVAEGVERLDQADLLDRLGCELLQGYALGRPARADAQVPVPRRTADRPVATAS